MTYSNGICSTESKELNVNTYWMETR